MCRPRAFVWSRAREGRAGAIAPALPESWLARELEDVRLERDTCVELHDLGQRVAWVDSEGGVDEPKRRVVQVEEAVAVSGRLELLLPHGELELAELGPHDVLLGDHAD